ncbi:MAG: DUF4157 domain-containing protein [Lewinellaceae bacterium]|nr:DUF4157 domain-containing protein [Lewinellaceae bacterium]
MQKAEATKTTAVVQQKPEPARPFFAPVVGHGNAVASGTPVVIQPKLKVNAPDDAHEREADAIAERVMRMPQGGENTLVSGAGPIVIQRRCDCAEEPEVQRQEMNEEEETVQRQTYEFGGTGPIGIQRACAACEEEKKLQRQESEEETVQTKSMMHPASGGGFTASPQLSFRIKNSKGMGSPLSGHTLSYMNSAFNADFSQVRIHTTSQAAEMSRGIRAEAFTYGSDIYFDQGKYKPETPEGKRLLAHELTHVVQQEKSRISRKEAAADPVVEKQSVCQQLAPSKAIEQTNPTSKPGTNNL